MPSERGRGVDDGEAFNGRELVLLRESTSNFDFHYMGSARIMGPIGKAFAEAIVEVARAYQGARERSRGEQLRALARVPGVYVPHLYDVRYDAEVTDLLIAALHTVVGGQFEIAGDPGVPVTDFTQAQVETVLRDMLGKGIHTIVTPIEVQGP